jgi:hypothetical protein
MDRPSGRLVRSAAIGPRRSVYDPLEPTKEPRWYEVTDIHGRVLAAAAPWDGPEARIRRVHAGAYRRWLEARGVQFQDRSVLLYTRRGEAAGGDYAE